MGVLGRTAPIPGRYAPEVLNPIPRSEGRLELDEGLRPEPEAAAGEAPAAGEDVWRAWEVSWREADGKPIVGVGRLTFPWNTPNLIESKSLKLYLHSLNNERFADPEAAARRIAEDVSVAAGGEVRWELLAPEAPELQPGPLPGKSLDGLRLEPEWIPACAGMTKGDAGMTKGGAGMTKGATGPLPALLRCEGGSESGEQQFHTHLFRCLCPVTAQPDWASVLVRCRGAAIEPTSLLAYLLSYRDYAGFHEHCVERIYRDIARTCRPESLLVQALFMRRGGIDINPWRGSADVSPALHRTLRQ